LQLKFDLRKENPKTPQQKLCY